MSRCAGLRSGLACKDSEGLFTGNETTQKSAECFSKGGKVREEIGTFNPKKTPTQLSLYTGRLCLTIHQGQNTGEALCTGKHTINCQKLQGAQSVRSARV